MAGLIFKNEDEVTQQLEYTLGHMFKEVTQRDILIDEGATIPKLEGEYALLTQMVSSPLTWSNNEYQDEDGVIYHSYNFTVDYNLTTLRGRTCSSHLNRFLQCLQLPYYRNKYFPDPSPYAYSDNSGIAKYRVPLNAQTYEDRANVLLTFNVVYLAKDMGSFESIDSMRVNITSFPSTTDSEEVESQANIDIT